MSGRTVLRRARLTHFFKHVLEDVPIERQIGNDLFEARVFIAELTQFANFRRSKRPESSLPGRERGFADAELARDVGQGCPSFRLSQRSGDLFVGVAEFFPLLMERYGLPGAMGTASAVAILGLLVTWFLLPEPKGQSLERISRDDLLYSETSGS